MHYTVLETVVHDDGVAALTPQRTGLARPLGERSGYFVDLALLMTLARADALTLAWVSPAVLAICIALAVVALATDALDIAPGWAGVAGIGVAASVLVTWTAVGYQSNLAVDSILLVAASAAVGVVFDGPRRVGGPAIAIAAAFVIHAFFSTLFVAMVAGCCVVAVGLARLVPRVLSVSPRAAIRLGVSLALGVAGAAALFLLTPQLPFHAPIFGPQHVTQWMAARMSSFHLAATVPLAVVGGLVLFGTDGSRRRLAVIVLLAWALESVAGSIAYREAGVPLPPYRAAGFALGIPVLGVLLGAGVASAGVRLASTVDTAGAWRANARRVGGVLVSAAIAGAFALAGYAVWSTQRPHFDALVIGQVRTVDAYLDEASIPLSTPVRFAVSATSTAVRQNIVRNKVLPGMSPDRYGAVRVLPMQMRNPPPVGAVIVALSALDRRMPPGHPLAPGVVLVTGPAPERAVTAAPEPTAPGPLRLAGMLVACLAGLAVAGVGWAISTVGMSPGSAIAASPAVGLAVLAIAGLVASRLSISLSGTSGVVVVLLSAALGWAPLAVPLVRRVAASQRATA